MTETTHYLYVICEATDQGPVKIGFSKDPARRLRSLQTAHPQPLKLVHQEAVESGSVRAMERAIHRTLKHHRTHGEWFSLTPEQAVAEIKHAVILYGDVDDLAGKMRSGYVRF